MKNETNMLLMCMNNSNAMELHHYFTILACAAKISRKIGLQTAFHSVSRDVSRDCRSEI